jgi:NAD(P)H-dependent FMN reductase
MDMHIFVLIGSHRHKSQSTKVGGYIEAVWQRLFPDDTVYCLDLAGNPLPLRSEWFRDHSSAEYKAFAPQRIPIAEQLDRADAVVVISPEWSGMAAPWVKNFFLYANPHLLGNKPGLLMWVSSGRGGHYPIAELRMSSAKNTQICYIPQHIVISHVEEVLNDHELEGTEKTDGYIKRRIQYALSMLRAYGEALGKVRATSPIDFDHYKNGM